MGRIRQFRTHGLVASLVAVLLFAGVPATLHRALVDLRFLWSERHATGDIALVAIDSGSIESLGVWPWPRQFHADLIDRLGAAGAADIVFDIDFSSQSSAAGDLAFETALKQAGGSVVLPTFGQLTDPSKKQSVHINRPLPQFGRNAWPALVNVGVDPDGLVRRYPFGEMLEGQFMPSMGAVLAGQHDMRKGSFLVDFSINSATVPRVSYADVLRGDPETLKKLANKKVIVGATAIELGDRFHVPNSPVMAGPMLQVLAAESILQGRALYPLTPITAYAAPLLLALLLLLVGRRIKPLIKAGGILVFAMAAEAAATWLQSTSPAVADTSLIHIVCLAYLVAIAIDEIDFRGWLGRIAEQRFQRIAMSLGDGLVCTDRDGLITVWNPGAVAIFGYDSDEMVGQSFDRLVVGDAGPSGFLASLDPENLRRPGGRVMELQGRRANGETFPLEACFSGWAGTDGFHVGAILRDITVRKREAERIRYLAEYDQLTGLANRNTLHAHLCDALPGVASTGEGLVLLVIGLEKFQIINTMMGHDYGDDVLKTVGERLRKLNPDAALIARLSGDEFALVMRGHDLVQQATEQASRIIAFFENVPLLVGNRRQSIAVRIGLAFGDDSEIGAEALLGNAHLALSRAKRSTTVPYIVFESGIRSELEMRLALEAELVQASDRGEFELFYQPQVNLVDGRLVGVEALIRWRHPQRGLVPPGLFMPVINTSAISDRVAFWVMETACRQGRLWQDAGHRIRMGINLSPSLIESGDLLRTVETVLDSTGIAPELVELEVTEDILITDDAKVLTMFRDVQALGVKIVFDDFGTGFASLSYLKKFPLDGLKVDQTFVRDLMTSKDDAAIVSTTITLSKLLGRAVIAEGIEDAATAEKLRDMGCHEGQGYHFGKPMPVAEFEEKFLSPPLAQLFAS